MHTTIRMTEEVDTEIRQQVAELYAQAPVVAFPEGPMTGWVPARRRRSAVHEFCRRVLGYGLAARRVFRCGEKLFAFDIEVG
jgi:hypothetical protein